MASPSRRPVALTTRAQLWDHVKAVTLHRATPSVPRLSRQTEKISRLEVLASSKTVASTFWFHFQCSWQLNKMHFHPLSLSGLLSMPGLGSDKPQIVSLMALLLCLFICVSPIESEVYAPIKSEVYAPIERQKQWRCLPNGCYIHALGFCVKPLKGNATLGTLNGKIMKCVFAFGAELRGKHGETTPSCSSRAWWKKSLLRGFYQIL
ncbi:hypothetical protein KUCAC02_025731, partial [Chaenocephalus aceratus]